MARTADALKGLFPPPIQPLYGIINRLLLGDRLCQCLALKPASPAAKVIFDAVLAARATIARLGMLPPRRPIFEPGRSAGSVYPGGYELSDLGVDARRRDATPEPGGSGSVFSRC